MSTHAKDGERLWGVSEIRLGFVGFAKVGGIQFVGGRQVGKTDTKKARRSEGHEELKGKRRKKMVMKVQTTAEEERIGAAIVDAAYAVHVALGPGLVKKIYEVCFCHELAKRKVRFERQVNVPIIYDGIRFDEGVRLDVLVKNLW